MSNHGRAISDGAIKRLGRPESLSYPSGSVTQWGPWMARAEAAVLDERGYRPNESCPRLSESAWEAHNFNRQNGGPSAKLRRAAFLHLVKGYNKTAAVRVAGFDNEENGRRTLRRFVKANFPHLGP